MHIIIEYKNRDLSPFSLWTEQHRCHIFGNCSQTCIPLYLCIIYAVSLHLQTDLCSYLTCRRFGGLLKVTCIKVEAEQTSGYYHVDL